MANRSFIASAAILISTALPGAVRGFDGVPTSTAGFIGMASKGPLDAPTLIESRAQLAAVFGGYDDRLANPYLAPSVDAFFQNGGKRCHVVRVAANSDAAYEGSPSRRTGIHAFGGVDEISIVCAPGATSLLVQLALIAHCEDLGDRLCILDSLPGVDADGVQEQRSRLVSSPGYATLYYPWIRVDPVVAGAALLPPSGFVAGVWARSDEDVGVWKSPIGQVLTALDVERAIGDAEQDVLNPLGINAIREFAGSGIQVWGARTISSDPEWKYLPVRRLLVFLAESIHEGTEWAVFEPNDAPLWDRMRSEVEDFLFARWRDGAFQGTTTKDAFFVRVDRSTMTQADLDAGRTVLLVGVAPLRPAEFTIFRVVHERVAPGARFVRGDTNGDGLVNISDPIRVLEFLFAGTAPPPCADAADATDDGQVTITSAVYVLNFLFGGGPPIRPPYPDCGEDSTPDALSECQDPHGACP